MVWQLIENVPLCGEVKTQQKRDKMTIYCEDILCQEHSSSQPAVIYACTLFLAISSALHINLAILIYNQDIMGLILNYSVMEGH